MNGMYYIGEISNHRLTVYSKRECGWEFKFIGSLGMEEEPFTLMEKATAINTIENIKEIVGNRLKLVLIPYQNGRSMGI